MRSAVPFYHTVSGDPDAPALLLLHGFMGDGGDWREVIDRLGADFRCLCVDLPGHGRTPARDPEDCTMAASARGIVELADDLGINRFHVAGYSMGGRLALYLTLHHPARVDRCILESASPGLATEGERAERRAHDEALAQQLERGDLEAFLRAWYAQPLFDTLRADPAGLDALIARRRSNDPKGLAASLRGMSTGAQESLWEALGEIARPLHLVVGERDAKFCSIAQAMAARCPTVRVQVVAGAGHNVHWEKAAEYTEVLRQWLSSD